MILREASAADIDFVMATERLPGYEAFIGQGERQAHAAEMARASSRYLIADADGAPVAFALLQELDDPGGNIYLQRLAVARQGEGLGGWTIRAVQDWVFARPHAHRLHLHFSVENERGKRLYAGAGFREEGIEREVYAMPDGRRVSRYGVSILRREWEALRAV